MPLRKLDALLSHPEHGIADQLTPLRGMFDEVPNPDNWYGWRPGPAPDCITSLRCGHIENH